MNLEPLIESLFTIGIIDITFTRTSADAGPQKPAVVAHQRIGNSSSASSIEHFASAETWSGAFSQVEHKAKHCARLTPVIDKNKSN